MAIVDAVMGHFTCGRQTHGHQSHGPQKTDLFRLVDNMLSTYLNGQFCALKLSHIEKGSRLLCYYLCGLTFVCSLMFSILDNPTNL